MVGWCDGRVGKRGEGVEHTMLDKMWLEAGLCMQYPVTCMLCWMVFVTCTESAVLCDFSFAYIPTIGLHATLGVLLHVVTEMQIHTLQTALRQYMHCKLHQSNYVRCKVHRSRAHTSTWSWSFVVVLLLASLSHLHRQPPHCSSSCNHCHHCCGCGHHTCTQ